MKKLFSLFAAFLFVGTMWGTTVTYTTSSGSPVVTGTAPTGSSASFTDNTNQSNHTQMLANGYVQLTLTNLGGINISNITLSMKSNKKGGTGTLKYSVDGGTSWTYVVGSSSAGVAYSDNAWNGSYSTDYGDVSKAVSISNATGLIIRIDATVNSLYCQSFKLTYETISTDPTVSAEPDTVNVLYTGAEDQTVTLTYSNWGTETYIADPALFSDEEGKFPVTPSWISNLAIDETDYETVTFDVAANTGDERTVYLKVSVLGDNNSTDSVIVPIIQAPAPVDPTISFRDSTLDIGYTLDLSELFTSNSEGAVTYSITAGGSYATLNGKILTGVAVGNVTVQASQAAAVGYNEKSMSNTITVQEHVVKAGTYNIVPGNALWGTSYSGTVNTPPTSLSASKYDVTVTFNRNTSNYMYVTNDQTRAYNGYTVVLTAPEGFVLSEIIFTGDTWVAPTASVGEMSNKTWSGYDNSVTFTFSGTSYVTNIKVTYEVPTIPIISAQKMDFGTAIIDESEDAYELDTVLVVVGANLTEAIEATGSTHVTVTGTLTKDGGNLNLHIVAAPGDFSEKITLTSGETSIDVDVTGRVNQTIILPGTAATITPVTQAMNVTVDGVGGVKAGTSTNAGTLKITVPANTDKLHFFSAAWDGEAGNITLTAPSGVTLSKTTLDIQDDSGISGGGSSYTLKELDLGDDCRFDLTLSGVTGEIDITITSTNRFVVWGATYETTTPPTALEDVETSVKAVKVLRDGQIFILRGDKTFNAQGQLVK